MAHADFSYPRTTAAIANHSTHTQQVYLGLRILLNTGLRAATLSLFESMHKIKSICQSWPRLAHMVQCALLSNALKSFFKNFLLFK